jgi:hypothetical protein
MIWVPAFAGMSGEIGLRGSADLGLICARIAGFTPA